MRLLDRSASVLLLVPPVARPLDGALRRHPPVIVLALLGRSGG